MMHQPRNNTGNYVHAITEVGRDHTMPAEHDVRLDQNSPARNDSVLCDGSDLISRTRLGQPRLNRQKSKTTKIKNQPKMKLDYDGIKNVSGRNMDKWKKSAQLRTRRWFRLEGKQTKTEPTTPSPPDRLKARCGPSQMCHAATSMPEPRSSQVLKIEHDSCSKRAKPGHILSH